MHDSNTFNFSHVPRRSTIYLEFIVGEKKNSFDYILDFAEDSGILKKQLLDKGYIPIWLKLAPELSNYQITRGREAPNRGNYFMSLWLDDERAYSMRFWIQYDYAAFEKDSMPYCSLA